MFYNSRMYVLAAMPIPRSLQEQIAPFRTNIIFQKYLRPSRIELHITLKAPQQISDFQKNSWIEAAQKACKKFKPIDINITSLEFITTTVLAFNINPAPFLPLHESILLHLEKYNNGGDTIHEGGRFRPHITIGRSLKGPLNAAQRAQILKSLAPITSPKNHTAQLVRLYGREEGAYRPLKDVGLTVVGKI